RRRWPGHVHAGAGQEMTGKAPSDFTSVGRAVAPARIGRAASGVGRPPGDAGPYLQLPRAGFPLACADAPAPGCVRRSTHPPGTKSAEAGVEVIWRLIRNMLGVQLLMRPSGPGKPMMRNAVAGVRIHFNGPSVWRGKPGVFGEADMNRNQWSWRHTF